MSTNKTENLKLHLWSPADPVSLSEVNENFTALDASIAGVEGSIENVRGVAEGAAETAVTHKNYAIGTYTGTGQYQTISLGFRPSMLIISEYYAVTDDASEAQGKISVFVDALNGGKLNLQSDGVLLYADESRVYPRVNKSGYKYRYIAFR